MRARLLGAEFEEDGKTWRVLEVGFDAEYEQAVAYYHLARQKNATIDDCEYSAVEEVEDWIHATRQKKATAGSEPD